MTRKPEYWIEDDSSWEALGFSKDDVEEVRRKIRAAIRGELKRVSKDLKKRRLHK